MGECGDKLFYFIYILHPPVAFSESCETFTMESFMKIVNSWKPLTIFAKSSILDVWLMSECASINSKHFFFILLWGSSWDLLGARKTFMKAFEARQRKMKRKFGFNNLSILSDKFCLINSNHQVCFRYVHRSTEPGENAQF